MGSSESQLRKRRVILPQVKVARDSAEGGYAISLQTPMVGLPITPAHLTVSISGNAIPPQLSGRNNLCLREGKRGPRAGGSISGEKRNQPGMGALEREVLNKRKPPLFSLFLSLPSGVLQGLGWEQPLLPVPCPQPCL